MLYGRHLGYQGDFEKQLAAREPKAVELFEAVEEVKEEAAKFMKVRAVWQFFEAEAEAARCVSAGGRITVAHLEFQAAENGRPAVSRRLHSTGTRWKKGSPGDFCGHSRGGSARAVGGGKKHRLLLPFAWATGA
jgi:hypothetical protein